MKTKTLGQGFTLVETLIVIIILALLTVMAVPAYQKIHARSQDKAVMNNLRTLNTAARSYLLENGGNAVNYDDLVSKGYLQPLKPVAGEKYPQTITLDQPLTATGVAGKRTVTFSGGSLMDEGDGNSSSP